MGDKKATALAVRETAGLMQMNISVDEYAERCKAFQALKNKVLDPNTDIKSYKRKGTEIRLIGKAGWRKVARAYQLSIAIIDKTEGTFRQGKVEHFEALYRVRVEAPWGDFVEAESSASTEERFCSSWDRAAIRNFAQTRATNRAISDLVGGGELSAEEVTDDNAGGRSPSDPKPATLGDVGRMFRHSAWPDDKAKIGGLLRGAGLDPNRPASADGVSWALDALDALAPATADEPVQDAEYTDGKADEQAGDKEKRRIALCERIADLESTPAGEDIQHCLRSVGLSPDAAIYDLPVEALESLLSAMESFNAEVAAVGKDEPPAADDEPSAAKQAVDAAMAAAAGGDLFEA